MYAEERQQAIAASVARRGRLSVAEIASDYAVTTETVRRDLTVLEKAGVVRRVHGGVVPAASLTMIEIAVAERDRAHAPEKERIAQAGLDLLPEDGGTVLLDAGTTLSRFAAHLPHDRKLTVITHAVPVAARVAGLAHVDLRLLPGRVRRTTQAAVGADTVAALSTLRADVAFIGTNGVTAGARPHHPRRRRGRDQAGDGPRCPPGGRAHRLLEDRRRDHPPIRETRGVSHAGHRRRHRGR